MGRRRCGNNGENDWRSELDEESEEYNPRSDHLHEEDMEARNVASEIADLLIEVSRSSRDTTRARKRYLRKREQDFLKSDWPDDAPATIISPEEIFDRVHSARRFAVRLKDQNLRSRMLQDLQRIEEKAFDQYEPYIHEQIYDVGGLLYAHERNTRDQKDPFIRPIFSSDVARDVCIRRTRRSVEEAIEFIKNSKNTSPSYSWTMESLRSDLIRLDAYAREPFIWGVEEASDAFFDAVTEIRSQPTFSPYRPISDVEKQKITKLLHEIEECVSCISDTKTRSVYERYATSARESAERLYSAGSGRASEEALSRVDEGSLPWARVILRVSDLATKEEIRSAYRKLILETHPDRQPTERIAWATKTTADVNRAYDVLLRYIDRMQR